MRYVAGLIILFVAACGGPDFTGTYEGSYQGQSATVTLEQDGDKLTGTIRFAGAQSNVDGTVNEGRASGTVRNPTLGVELAFEAEIKDDDSIDWVYTIDNPMTGRQDRLPIRLQPKGASSSKGQASESPDRDPRLFGRWYQDLSSGIPNGSLVTTRVFCALSPDGTYRYEGGPSVITLKDHPGSMGGTGAAGGGNQVVGKWKTENGVLFSKPEGATQWVPLGRYSVSGNDMLLYTGGGKQLWSRQ